MNTACCQQRQHNNNTSTHASKHMHSSTASSCHRCQQHCPNYFNTHVRPRIHDHTETSHFQHVRTHPRTRVATPKIWWHYTALWLFMWGRALACKTSHTSAHVEGGAWGGRHPSRTCDSNSLGRDGGAVYELPVLSVLNRGGGCFERSP